MNTQCALAPRVSPRHADIGWATMMVALWPATWRTAYQGWMARMRRHRDEDAFDRLDARALRDIGAEALLTAQRVRSERDEMQWRIDSQFRG